LLTVVLISGLKLLPLTVTRKAATINISMYYLYVGIPASAIVMIIYLLINNVNTLKSFFVSREISN
jgi:TRAP-type C4-dicarboxylate transport system permease small subunit